MALSKCFISVITVVLFTGCLHSAESTSAIVKGSARSEKDALPAAIWQAPDEKTIPNDAKGEMIHYGKDLIANSSHYFGPKGKLGVLSNGLNCQNCHLEAGTRIFGNNFAAVMSSYPKIIARSGQVTSPVARIKGGFERSLNGKMPDSTSKEIRAMLAYMQWLNQGVKPDKFSEKQHKYGPFEPIKDFCKVKS